MAGRTTSRPVAAPLAVAGAAAAAAAALATVAVSLLYTSRQRQCQRRLRSLGLLDDKEARIGLVVDVGSSSVRCSAYVLRPGGGGKGVVAVPGTMRQVKRDAISPVDGTADAETVLGDMEAVVSGCLGALRAQGLAHLVGVVGFAAFVMNLVGVDKTGSPVTRVLTYADRHPRTAVHVERLREAMAVSQAKSGGAKSGTTKPGIKILGGGKSKGSSSPSVRSVYEATGAPLHSAYAPAQLCRLAEEEPATVQRVHKWQTLVSLALARWTGQPHLPISFSEASWTGMLDFRGLKWADEVLALLAASGVDAAALPGLADYDEGPAGADLSPEYARRWPELAGARLFLGIGDGACANIGSGCAGPTRLAVTVGTSAAARIVVNGTAEAARAISVPPGLWCYRIDRARLLLGGALTDGGSVVQWMTQTFQMGSPAAAEALALAKAPDSHGLTVLPFLSGERAPGWNPDARAAIAGMTKATQPADIYRAGLESVALRLGSVVHLMAGSLAPGAVVGASGTALEASPLWRQILADVLGMDVVLGTVGEATSAGAAVLMAEGLFGRTADTGIEMGVQQQAAAAARHMPDPQAHAAYRTAMRRQQQLYDALYPPAQGEELEHGVKI